MLELVFLKLILFGEILCSVGRDVILPQTDVSDYFDSPSKALPSLRNGLGVTKGKVGGVGEGEGGRTNIGMQNEKIIFKNMF